MNIGNPPQIINYIFSSTNDDKIKSYINILKNIKNVDFTDVHPVFLITIIHNLKKSVNETYDEFKQFCNRENIKNISRYNRNFNDTLTYLQEIKINYKHITRFKFWLSLLYGNTEIYIYFVTTTFQSNSDLFTTNRHIY